MTVGELSIGEDFVEFPVTAITSGLHDADGDQKVYIEPAIIKDSISNLTSYLYTIRTSVHLRI